MSKRVAKAKSPKEPASYEVNDIVLGKVRGFPPWPGMVVEPESAPPGVQKERPGGKKNAFYCIRFFPKGEFSWLVPKDISKLQKHEIETFVNEPHKKPPRTELLTAYRIALDPEPWTEEQRKLAEEASANAGNEEESSPEDQDQLASESENSTGSKKRKRTSSKRGGGGGGRSKKSKANIESEDDGEGEEDEEVVSKPPTKKAKTTKGAAVTPRNSANKKGGKGEEEGEDEPADPEAMKVRDWRHKLQKTFLSSNKPEIKAEDMPAMDDLFTQIENYDRMTIECLSFSKIGKVMRHIASLKENKIPPASEAQFNFRERAKGLMEKWHYILNSSSNDVHPPPASAVNGSAVGETSEPAGMANLANGEMHVGDMSVLTTLGDVTLDENSLQQAIV